jgi:hypothetical protein
MMPQITLQFDYEPSALPHELEESRSFFLIAISFIFADRFQIVSGQHRSKLHKILYDQVQLG